MGSSTPQQTPLRRLMLTHQGRHYVDSAFPPPETAAEFGDRKESRLSITSSSDEAERAWDGLPWEVYYDTRDLTLARQGASLRERAGAWALQTRKASEPSVPLIPEDGTNEKPPDVAMAPERRPSASKADAPLMPLASRECAVGAGAAHGGFQREFPRGYSVGSKSSVASPDHHVTVDRSQIFFRLGGARSPGPVKSPQSRNSQRGRESSGVPFATRLAVLGLRPLARLCVGQRHVTAELPPESATGGGRELELSLECAQFDTAYAEPAMLSSLLGKYMGRVHEMLRITVAELRGTFHRHEVNAFLRGHNLDLMGGGSCPETPMIVAYVRVCRPSHFETLRRRGLLEETQIVGDDELLHPVGRCLSDTTSCEAICSDDMVPEEGVGVSVSASLILDGGVALLPNSLTTATSPPPPLRNRSAPLQGATRSKAYASGWPDP